MSRHTLRHKTDPNSTFVVGYDRPFGAYFMQLWDGDNELVGEDDCFDPDELESLGAVVPSGLREALRLEAIGKADTNTVKDWRGHAEHHTP